MNKVKFTKIIPEEIPTIISWFGENYKYNIRCPSKRVIEIYCVSNLSQQDIDTITAYANAIFVTATFSQE